MEHLIPFAAAVFVAAFLFGRFNRDRRISIFDPKYRLISASEIWFIFGPGLVLLFPAIILVNAHIPDSFPYWTFGPIILTSLFLTVDTFISPIKLRLVRTTRFFGILAVLLGIFGLVIPQIPGGRGLWLLMSIYFLSFPIGFAFIRQRKSSSQM